MFSLGLHDFLYISLVTGKTNICSLPLGLPQAGVKMSLSWKVCCIYRGHSTGPYWVGSGLVLGAGGAKGRIRERRQHRL